MDYGAGFFLALMQPFWAQGPALCVGHTKTSPELEPCLLHWQTSVASTWEEGAPTEKGSSPYKSLVLQCHSA
jgi:hypothetical protein